jgi:hypothetical protein
MNLIKTFVTVAVVAGLTIGGYIAGSSKDVIVPEVKVNVPSTLGALTSNVIPAFDLTVGDLRTWSYNRDFTAATTTVCAIQAPAATSTLVYGAVKLDVSSTTASTVTVAKATTAYATTTLIREASVSANAKATVLMASTTESALAQTNRIFGPNEYVVIGMAGGIGTFSPEGSCVAKFAEF